MIEHKKLQDAVFIEGIGYCVEVVHTRFNGSIDESYVSYTPIDLTSKKNKK